MSDPKQDRIKARAHEIWENEGHAHGHHERHWEQASREIETEGEIAPEGPAQSGLDGDLSGFGDGESAGGGSLGRAMAGGQPVQDNIAQDNTGGDGKTGQASGARRPAKK